MHKVKEHIEKLECEQSRILQLLASLPIEGCEKSKDDYYYIADMAKDIAGAMKDEAEAAYYKCLAERIHEQKEEDEMLKKMGMKPMGYDNWRYSSGRFAPTGKGHYAGHGGNYGYTSSTIYPIMDGEEEMMMSDYFGAYIFDPTQDDMIPKHYSRTGRQSSGDRSSQSRSNSGSGNYGYDRYDQNDMNRRETGKGRNYDNFMESRRHYTETKDQRDKETMKQDAKMHMRDIESSMLDIWNSADPDLKKELKNDMTALISKMPV